MNKEKVEIQELEEELKKAKAVKQDNHDEIIRLYNSISNIYIKLGKYREVLNTSLEMLPYFTDLRDYKVKSQKAKKLQFIGGLLLNLGDYEKAVEYSNNSVIHFKELDDELSSVKSYIIIGKVNNALGNLDICLENLFFALDIMNKFKDKLELREFKTQKMQLGEIYESIAVAYSKLEQTDLAEEYSQKSIGIFQETNTQKGIYKNLINMGVMYSKSDSHKALRYYNKALDILKPMKNYSNLAICTSNIGSVYSDIKKYDLALKYYFEALKISEDNGVNAFIPHFNQNLGRIYIELGKPDKALEFVNKSLEVSQKKKKLELIKANHELLSYIYQKKEEFKTALEHYQHFHEVSNKIINKEMIKKISGLKKKHDESNQKLIETQKDNSLISGILEKSINMNFVGRSPAIKKVLELAMTVASNKDANVLIIGENGTGKEIIAHIIHHAGFRKDKLFVPVNCNAIPESLAESEFFGYKKGAFTGADKDKIGFLEAANDGTIFMDEITEMPISLQSKLLRVLEDRKIRKIGSNKEVQVNFRVISATNKDVKGLIKSNDFRIDLFYRINTMEIHIPPLRERKEDIEALLEFFIMEFSRSMNKKNLRIENSVIQKLYKYDFPGNVRELRNMAERAIILLKGSVVTPDLFDLPRTQSDIAGSHSNIRVTLGDMERMMILQAMKEKNNNQREAAKILGISYSTLYRKLKSYKPE